MKGEKLGVLIDAAKRHVHKKNTSLLRIPCSDLFQALSRYFRMKLSRPLFYLVKIYSLVLFEDKVVSLWPLEPTLSPEMICHMEEIKVYFSNPDH